MDTTEMVNGFPVLRIWWPDESLKALLRPVFLDEKYRAGFEPILTARLSERVHESLE
jgi:hypothetical protein